jgi:sigma-E factor negative regulatory protein RseC
MNEPAICHQGIVKEISDNMLYVEIERRAACASCHAKSVCISSEKRDETIHAFVNNADAFHVGELVQVKLEKSLGAKAVIIAYLFPFLALALGLFVTYYFTKNELLSVGVAFAATILYFLFVKKMDKRFKKHFNFIVSKMEIENENY